MNSIFTIVTVLIASLTFAQAQKLREPTQEEYQKALAEQMRISKLRYATLDAADRNKIPFLKDFLTLYPNAIVRYLSFAKADFPSLSVNTTLHDRYQFNLRVPVRYSKDNKEIIGYGEPICHLLEIISVTPRDDGAGGVELHGTKAGDLQEHFGLQNWDKLVESKGDFSTLGFKLKVTNPVPNFDLVKKDLKSLERKIPNPTEQDTAVNSQR